MTMNTNNDLLKEIGEIEEEIGSDRLTEYFAAKAKSFVGLECSDPELGAWFERFDLSFLAHVLLQESEAFLSTFPTVRIEKGERAQLFTRLLDHSEECEYCMMKIQFEEELEEMCKGAAKAITKRGEGDSFSAAGAT